MSKILSKRAEINLASHQADWIIQSRCVEDSENFFENHFVRLDELREKVIAHLRSVGNYKEIPIMSYQTKIEGTKTTYQNVINQTVLIEHLESLGKLLCHIQDKLE